MSAPAAAFGVQAPFKRRSRAGYWIAGAVLVIAVGLAIALGVTRFVDTLDQPSNYARTDVPGSVSVTVRHPGERVVYAENTTRTLTELDVTVRGPAGDLVTVDRFTGGEVTYDMDGRHGNAVGSFDADEQGVYEVTAKGSRGAIAVGTNLFDDLIGIFLGPAIVFGVGLAISVTLLVTTLIARRRRPPVDGGIGIG